MQSSTQSNDNLNEVRSDTPVDFIKDNSIKDKSINIADSATLQQKVVSSSRLVPCRNTWMSSDMPCLYDVVTPRNAPFKLVESEIRTLESTNYVGGEVIDALFIIFSAELYKDGIKVAIIPECMFKCVQEDLAFATLIPKCSGVDYVVAASYFSSHWCLVLVDVARKIIMCIDPKSTYTPEKKIATDLAFARQIVWYQVLGKELSSSVPARIPDWTEVCFDQVSFPKQLNGYDCGVFVLMYFFYYTRGAVMDFDHSDILKIRGWLCSLLIDERTYTYEVTSPYIEWMFDQMEHQAINDHLGSLRITDVRAGCHVAETQHVMDWLKRNSHLFQSLPCEPSLLRYSVEEQREMVTRYEERKSTCWDEIDEKVDDASFVFPVQHDFRTFMKYMDKFDWTIGVRGPFIPSWESDGDPATRAEDQSS